jgi:hypothetical protein
MKNRSIVASQRAFRREIRVDVAASVDVTWRCALKLREDGTENDEPQSSRPRSGKHKKQRLHEEYFGISTKVYKGLNGMRTGREKVA